MAEETKGGIITRLQRAVIDFAIGVYCWVGLWWEGRRDGDE